MLVLDFFLILDQKSNKKIVKPNKIVRRISNTVVRVRSEYLAHLTIRYHLTEIFHLILTSLRFSLNSLVFVCRIMGVTCIWRVSLRGHISWTDPASEIPEDLQILNRVNVLGQHEVNFTAVLFIIRNIGFTFAVSFSFFFFRSFLPFFEM